MDNILQYYQEAFHLKKAQFMRIDHNDTIIAAVYKVVVPDHPSMILKLCTKDKHFHRELFFLNKLKGLLPIPTIIDTIKPTSSHRGGILMPFIEGNIPTEKDFSPTIAMHLGKMIATLHSHKTTGYGDLTDPTSLKAHAAADFQEKFYEELEECAPNLSASWTDQCKAFFTKLHSRLQQVDGPCMIHSDFRPGNMLVHGGKLAVLLDWSGSKSGFAEQDFILLHHRKWLPTYELKEAFLAGYQEIRPLPNYQAIMPLLQLGRALAIAGWCLKQGIPTEKHQALYAFNKAFLDNFDFSEGN